MQKKTLLRTTAFLSLSLAFAGCMKSGEDATGVRAEPATVLDANHGGARIALPQIDPAALGKGGADTTIPDTLARVWFQLSITGEGMSELSYSFPVTKQANPLIEIKGIPAGKNRSFHGRLVNGSGLTTYEGITLADIQGGVFTEVRLFLAKAGSASVCVIIEGQPLPPCAAVDTVTPPPNPWPSRDSSAIGGCWRLSSAWVSGKVRLYDTMMNGSMGTLQSDSGATLFFTTWARHRDTLAAILVSPDLDQKWLFYGFVAGNNEGWMGTITNYTTGKTTPFGSKSLACSAVPDSGKTPRDTVPKPVGSIPMPGSGAPRTTLCFEMRFDYANSACEVQGYAKMDFLGGNILFGDMTIADRPAREYSNIIGSYDSASINFYGVTQDIQPMSRDTLSLQGRLSADATMAKGSYVRLPSEKKGIWTMSLVTCGSWTPKYPDPSCALK
jgi:hypothetical protein